MLCEQPLKDVDDIFFTDSGCATPINYIEQTSWILFLKYLSDLESEISDEVMLTGKEFRVQYLFFKIILWKMY